MLALPEACVHHTTRCVLMLPHSTAAPTLPPLPLAASPMPLPRHVSLLAPPVVSSCLPLLPGRLLPGSGRRRPPNPTPSSCPSCLWPLIIILMQQLLLLPGQAARTLTLPSPIPITPILAAAGPP
jgi:hypothetical protein